MRLDRLLHTELYGAPAPSPAELTSPASFCALECSSPTTPTSFFQHHLPPASVLNHHLTQNLPQPQNGDQGVPIPACSGRPSCYTHSPRIPLPTPAGAGVLGAGGTQERKEGKRTKANLYLGRGDPLEEGMATHSSILAWRIPWTEEPGGLQSTGSQTTVGPFRGRQEESPIGLLYRQSDQRPSQAISWTAVKPRKGVTYLPLESSKCVGESSKCVG